MISTQGRFIDRSHYLCADAQAWYDCSDGNFSPVLTDKSGYGRHGTLLNGPTWISTEIGLGIRLDGVNDCIRVSSVPTGLAGGFTASALVRCTNNADYRAVVSQGSPSVGMRFYARCIGQNYGRAYVASGGGQTYTNSPLGLTLGAWEYHAVTYGGGTLTYYVDGVAGTPALGSMDEGSALAIGAYAAVASPTFPFMGDIAGVFIHSRALSAAEIAEFHARLSSGHVEDLYEQTSPLVFDMFRPR